MTLVHIVYVPTADLRGPDTERMGKVEDVPDELARLMLGDGTARQPTDDEVAAYHASQRVEEKADEPAADSVDTAAKATKTRGKQQGEQAVDGAQ